MQNGLTALAAFLIFCSSVVIDAPPLTLSGHPRQAIFLQ
jgi:hypothetical protein